MLDRLRYLRSKSKLVPAVFVHIQKTAGTSIINRLKDHYYTNMVSHGDYVNQPIADLKGVAFVSGHFGFEYARPLIESRYAFTLLREPVDRILSLYSFCRTFQGKEFPIYRMARELEIEDFLRLGLDGNSPFRSHLWNHQTWSLACGWGNHEELGPDDFEPRDLLTRAIEHLDAFSHVGFLESFDEDFQTILSGLKIKAPAREQETRVNASPNRIARTQLSPATVEILENLTSLDRELYEAAWNRRGNGPGGR